MCAGTTVKNNLGSKGCLLAKSVKLLLGSLSLNTGQHMYSGIKMTEAEGATGDMGVESTWFSSGGSLWDGQLKNHFS